MVFFPVMQANNSSPVYQPCLVHLTRFAQRLTNVVCCVRYGTQRKPEGIAADGICHFTSAD